MFIRRHHHEVPLLNTTSTADISFMLLVFFLMTSSMNSDKGLSRQLPPTKSEQSAITDINRSNVLQIHLDANDALWIDGQTVADEQLQHEVESFLASRQSQRFMIEVTTDRRTSYDAYFNMQNTIVAACLSSLISPMSVWLSARILTTMCWRSSDDMWSRSVAMAFGS